MKKKITIYEKADKEIKADNLWRAKEILSGNLGNLGYDHKLYEKYGELLDKMGDKIEAGRYLFLSGKVQSESISLFLKKHSKKDPRNLIGTFPKAARLKNIDDYPDSVARKLKELGIKTEDLKQHSQYGSDYKESFFDKLIPLGCAGGFIFVAICAVIGLYTIGKWLIGSLGS